MILLSFIASASGPGELRTDCNVGCVASFLGQSGTTAWYEDAPAEHPDELGPTGLVRSHFRVHVGPEGATFDYLDPGACRAVGVEQRWGVSIVRTTRRLSAEGACIEVPSLYDTAVVVPDEGRARERAKLAFESAGLFAGFMRAIPSGVEFEGVGTVGELCSAIAAAGALDGDTLLCGIAGGGVTVYSLFTVSIPTPEHMEQVRERARAERAIHAIYFAAQRQDREEQGQDPPQDPGAAAPGE